MRGFPVLLLPALLLGCAPREKPRHPSGWLSATVVKAVDGDTLNILLDGRKEKVCLHRVNTPESIHADRKQNVPMGRIASDYVQKWLGGREVFLEFETGKPERDKHGSLLTYVHLADGTHVNLELVERGLSPFFTAYGKGRYAAEFKAAEKRALAARLGIWGDPELREKYLRLKNNK
jgi:micrococcal nuclease